MARNAASHTWRRRVLPRFLAMGTLALAPSSCTSGQEMEKGSAAAQPAALPTARAPAVTVAADGVRIELRPCAPESSSRCTSSVSGVRVQLAFPSGDEMWGITDGSGVALLRPTLEVLVANVEAGTAQVRAAGTTTTVSLAPLVEAERAAQSEAWESLAARLATQRARADDAIRFNTKIYHDPSPGPLVEDCSPTGPEQCFDGIDNDCDGRYDNQSCGYSSGALQWTVTWEGRADLDLVVAGPKGKEVSSKNPNDATSRLRLDRACDGTTEGCPGGNLENAVVPASVSPLSGTYQVRVEVRDVPETDDPIRGTLSGRIGNHTWHVPFELAPFPEVAFRIAYPVGADRDADSVVDEHDACPDDKGCWFADLAYRGCPDRDGDDVPDSIDACPDKTGISRQQPEARGCPLEFGDAWVTNQGVKINARVEFDTGKATLRPESQQIVTDISRAIFARPDGAQKLSIDGHTDEVGDAAANVALSRRRAETVRTALVERGVSADLLGVRGFGETRPLATNATDEGRQANRRVELVTLKPPPRTTQCW